jgi:hypothetical protein
MRMAQACRRMRRTQRQPPPPPPQRTQFPPLLLLLLLRPPPPPKLRQRQRLDARQTVDRGTTCRTTGKKTHNCIILCAISFHFILKLLILPREARDKHRLKALKKER